MLKFNYIKILYVTLCVLCLGAGFLYNWPWVETLLLLNLGYLGFILYGSFNVSSCFFLDLYNQANTTQKHIALTFDDGPSPETHRILDLLKKHQIKVTFFVIGKRVEEHPEIVKRMVEEGHQLGNHTFHHSRAAGFLSVKSLQEDLSQCIQAVERIVNLKMNLYRPPFGVTSPSIAHVVKKMNLKPIGWSLRSFDTTLKSAEQILKSMDCHVKSGDVLLFHDDRPKAHEVLEKMIPMFIAKQYTFLTVSELFEIKAYNHEK